MFNRSAFLAVVVAIVATVDGAAQGASIVPGIILRQPGEGRGVHLVAPTGLGSEPTFTFPSFSGTLLVQSSTSSPTFGGLTVTGGPITLDPGVGNNLTFANIPADPLTTIFLTLDGSGQLRTNTLAGGSVWLTSGTPITTPGTGGGQQYLGTSNAQDLVVAANATERLRITSAGTVTLPNVSVPQGSRFSISGTYAAALTADATQVNVNTTLNGAAAAFAARGASFTTTLTNNVNGLTLAGVYARTTLQNSSGTIADASGVYADFSRTSGGGSATITRYTGLRSRHITNNANISGIGLFIDGPNNTGVLPAGASFSGIVIDTIPASGSATRRVFFYNAAPSEQVLITAGGALALGTATPASSSKLEVAGTAGTPNVRLSALGGTAKNPAPVGYDRIVLANTNGDVDQVAASAVASVIGAQPLDGDLTALAGLTTTGIVVRDNTNSMVTRTLNASAPISITNANGVSGDPTISLGTVPVANGGTGATTLSANGVLIGNGTSPVTALATANNAMLVTDGTGAPSISTTFPSGVNVPFSQITGTIVASQFVGSGSTTNAVDLATAEVAGTLPVANGGTGATTLTANGVLIGNGTSPVTALATANNAMLVTDGTGVPSISTTFPSGVNVPASQITGTLPIANGGTNITTYTTGDILFASATNTLSKLPIGTSGQVLRVSAGGVPEWATGSTVAFSSITSGTNTSATMTVGTGASILLTGTGIVEANRFRGSGSTTDNVDLGTAEVAGTLPVANGGTGATDAATARTNLGAQAADGDLAAVAALTTTGFVVRDNTNSMVTRTLGATSPISITNADGVAGNPNISLGTVPVGNGGTGATTLTANGVLLGNGTSAVSATAVGATGQVLIGNTAAAPTWSSTPSVSSMSLTNTSNQLVLGTTTTTTITSPAPSASRTYTIPDAGANADFVMTQGAQTVNGSKTFVDNVVVGSGATAAQIRFREPSGDGTNFSSFQAQAQSGDINYTLPATLPSVGQVLQVTAVAGTNVTTAWVTPSSSIAVTTGRATAIVGTTDETNYTTVTDMNLTLQANTTYMINGILRFDNTGDNHETDVRFTYPSGTASIALARTSYSDALSEFDVASPMDFIAVATDDDPYIYAVSGVIYVGATGGQLQLAIRRNTNGSGTDQSRLMTGSWWSITR